MALSTSGGLLRAVAPLMGIAILVAAQGMLDAQGRRPNARPAPDDDVLPGVLMPWSTSMPSESEFRAVGATMAGARMFARSLRAIADVVTEAPGYNPVPAGCDIQISGTVGIVLNNTTKKFRRFRGDLLIGCLPFDVETRDGKKVRGGHGETRHFEDIVTHGENARKKGETPAFFYEVTATALRRMDWQKLAAMLDRP